MSPTPESKPIACKVCSGKTAFVGRKAGSRTGKAFELRHCAACGFSFVANPWTDFAHIYDEAYYHGRGSDPLVDYAFELDHPRETIRQYEWAGILRLIGNLVPLTRTTRWLDFGCGNGGLVRYCRENADCDIVGFEEGWIAERARSSGIPLLGVADLNKRNNSFDVITAIEVLEHVIEPLEVLRRIRALLKPGGLFFLTTGNAEPFARAIAKWPYVIPEIHVSFFEPRTLVRAFEQTGFRAELRGFQPGHERIIQFKLLKNLRVCRTRSWFHAVPWSPISRLCDARFKITAHPIGWAS